MSPLPRKRLRDVARRAHSIATSSSDTHGVPREAELDALLASGLFDPWYYALQTRTRMEPRDALEHYLREGAAMGLLPNPLTDVDAAALAPDELVAVLVSGAGRGLPVRPLLDVDALVAQHPEAADHPGGPAGFYLTRAHAGTFVPDLGPRSWTRFFEQREQQSKALQLITASGLFDHEYYRLQAGRAFRSERQAIWHFLETGESAGLSPTPLYERGWYRTRAGVSMPMTFRHFLRTGQVEGASGPHFDATTYLSLEPAAAEHPGGPLGHFVEHAGPQTLTVPAADSGVAAVEWSTLRHGLFDLAAQGSVDVTEAVVDWDAVQADVSGRVPGRVSVLIVTHEDRHLVRSTVESVLAGDERDVEIVLVDNGSHREIAAILSACFAADTRVHVQRLPPGSRAPTAANVALAASTGETVVLLANDARPQPGWLAPLLTALEAPGVLGVQPLIESADDTIWSAGIVSLGAGTVPVHWLADHPVHDVPGGLLRPDALSSVCLATRASHLADVQGLDATFGAFADVDLCLRLAASSEGHYETVTTSVVSRQLRDVRPPAPADETTFLARWGQRLPTADGSRWERTGFQAQLRAPVPLLVRLPTTVVGGPAAGLPRLRWAIKIAAQGGPRGDAWGDTYFAADLVRALRYWGQEAFVDRRGAHQRPGVDHLDDVTLTLRGLWPTEAQPGATNLLWVISHPDSVPAEEVQGFDRVYAAGSAWAAEMSTRSGRDVTTLLQATDPDRFTPEGEAMPGLGTLFVGRTREVLRPVVRDALQVGADLTVFGDGWEQFIDPTHVAGQHLANELVPSAYRGARIVLNDHWADMARLGFYSNRLFDAVASGARVVSDPVAGLEDVLGPSVRTYHSLDELRSLLDPEASVWGDDAVIASNAARVAAEHSFVARAKVLLADVLDARGITHDLRDRTV